MSGPLAGIKVLELCNFIAGPYAAMLLADMGAEVIKVENPQGGDPFRGWDLGGDVPTFWSYNRGKKSVTLNLQAAEGKEIFLKLCREADVLVENYRPGVTKKLGIDYDTLTRLNPKLIYVSITGLGATGPYAHRPVYDTVGQGMSGLMSLLTDRDNPRPVGPNFSDSLGGVFGALAALGALCERAATGRGQLVEVSMVGATLALLNAPATECLASSDIPGPISRPRASQAYAFTAADGLPFAVHLSSPPKFWEGLARALGHPELIEDPRFKSRPDRRRHYEELQRLLATFVREKPRAYWFERLEKEDVPYTPIYNMQEVFDDPQIKHLRMQIEIPRADKPAIRTVRFPADYSRSATDRPAPPPELGEHNLDILTPLGYDQEKLAALKEKGVL
jgi:crotonobetainyl-CoA:carnitine CoA-transferase CaiB-like acyl-CoA transferase